MQGAIPNCFKPIKSPAKKAQQELNGVPLHPSLSLARQSSSSPPSNATVTDHSGLHDKYLKQKHLSSFSSLLTSTVWHKMPLLVFRKAHIKDKSRNVEENKSHHNTTGKTVSKHSFSLLIQVQFSPDGSPKCMGRFIHSKSLTLYPIIRLAFSNRRHLCDSDIKQQFLIANQND